MLQTKCSFAWRPVEFCPEKLRVACATGKPFLGCCDKALVLPVPEESAAAEFANRDSSTVTRVILCPFEQVSHLSVTSDLWCGLSREAQGLCFCCKVGTGRQVAEPVSAAIPLEKECYEGLTEVLEGATPHMSQQGNSPGEVYWASLVGWSSGRRSPARLLLCCLSQVDRVSSAGCQSELTYLPPCSPHAC